jgi:parallel beta-helix repeat protein
MKKNRAILIILLLCLLITAAQAASTVYVDADSPNDPGSGTSEDPFRRIQDAINYAVSGDTVEIRAGVYTGTGNYNLDPKGKSIAICSINPEDSNIVANTVIDTNKAGRGFYIHSGEDANCIVAGLTIRNGLAAAGYNGAGIYCFDSSPTIRKCVIQDGYAVEGSGGGICFDYGSANISNCTVKGNTADYYGGGISCRFSSPTITGCTISGNTASLEGGGIDSGMSAPNIFNCIIIDNNSSLGGGINCYFPGVANVVNCTLVGNSADYIGGALYCWYGGGAVIKNSISWANSAPTGTQLGLELRPESGEGSLSVNYSDIQSGQTEVYDPCGQLVWGEGNIDSDPCFVLFDPNGDPNLWDLHLQSTSGRWNPGSSEWVIDANSSPCIDAGDPNSAWMAEPWPNGKRINIGAYGGTPQASKIGNIADLNIDGIVNFTDFALFAELWNEDTPRIEDLNIDGLVNLSDLEIFADNWLWSR